jgi:pimeloyl-ACP methyl ester carboxylesterase
VLADTLGIERFSVVGLSGGGPHALACAIAIPMRISGVAIVSSAGPIDAYHARSASTIGRLLRRASMPIVRLFIGAGVRLLPILLRRTSAKRMSTRPDKRVLARREMREAFRDELLEGLRPGSRGAVQEFGLHTRPWPFKPSDVSLTVHLWHGDADVIVPIDIAHYLAHRLRDCNATFLPGEGHLLIVEHIEEVLRTLVRDSTHQPTAVMTPS